MFEFTREERRVILFLIIIALLGVTIDFLVKKNSALKTVACFDQNFAKVNLNTADRELLKSVPGIGEKLAGRIIEYRRHHGQFKAKEELKNIKGITDYRYEKLKESLFVK